MVKDMFHNKLKQAVVGDMEALADIVELYMPLINRYSHVNGKLDEDLRQCILVEIVKSIRSFRFFSEDD